MSRATSDPEYANALFEQGIQAMLDGDVGVGKSIIRDLRSITLDNESFDKFIETCETGKEPNETLKSALDFARNTQFESE